jgi:oxygen-dependent protoporphyrinogen oxidase
MKYAVIGGGVAGLVTAIELRARGHEVTVLEREAQAGGKVRSERQGDWLVEHGPVGVLDNAPTTQALLKELDLAAAVCDSSDQTRRRFIFLDGKLREVPDSPPKLVISGSLSIAEKWRILREPHAAAPPGAVDETIRDFAVRRLGPSIAERFVEPIVTGVFAGDYARLSLRSAFPRIAELEREHGSLLRGLMATEKLRKAENRPRQIARLTTLQEGLGTLPAALVKKLGDAVKVGVDVGAIARFGEGWTVSTAEGALEFDRVVLAVPPDEATRLTQPVDAAIAEAFEGIPLASIAAVALGYRRADVRHKLDAFGFLAPRAEKQRVLGVIFMTSTFPGLRQAPADHVVLRCLIGGAHDAEAATLAEDALVGIATGGLKAMMGLDAAPVFQHVARWPRAIPQYVVGHAGRVATIEERGARIGLYATGASLRGVGVNDVVREAKALVARLGA